MDKRRLVDVAILGAVPFVMVFGNSMLIPVFPQLKKAMDLTQFQVGLLITVFRSILPSSSLWPGFCRTMSVGAKSSAGYARIRLGGLIAGARSVLLDQPYGVVLAGRIVQGVGVGGTYLLAVALAGDLFTDSGRTKALGILEAANGVAKVISPVLGVAVALIVWWAPFFVYGVLALPVAFLVWLVIEEPPIEQGRGFKGYGKALARIFKQRGDHWRLRIWSALLPFSSVRGVVVFVRRAGATIRHPGFRERPRIGRSGGRDGYYGLLGRLCTFKNACLCSNPPF